MRVKIFATILLNYLILFFSYLCMGQTGEWVWIKGDSTAFGADSSGNFGVQGVSSPTNNPPGLYEPCEWTDLNGNFWLFGGVRFFLPSAAIYGDLWKYNVASNEWTWMKGSSLPNDTGNYGVIGIPSPTNNPPARSWCMASWTDIFGNLWMFGGALNGVGVFNDLWKFDIAINQWTCINSNTQSASYGVQGIPSSTNHPGARTECATAWTDNSGNLWLFGGEGYDSTFTNGILNDLWKYNIATNEWTWMKGSPINWNLGNYGTLGVETPTNNPPARGGHARWKDSAGNFWLFGGGTSGVPWRNDLWRFNPLTNNWTWMSGSNAFDAIGDYGTKCLMLPTNITSSGYEQRSTWTDAKGDLWLFGGALNFSSLAGTSNDLWNYSLLNNQWVWVSGDSIKYPQGSWGTLGISTPSNRPNGRCGSVGWSSNNELFLFGGSTAGNCYNDLWKFTIDTTCISTSIIENNFANEIQIFPNPTTGELTIIIHNMGFKNAQFNLINLLGEQVLIANGNNTNTDNTCIKKININNLANGVYFLELIVDGRKIIRKVEKH